MALILNVNISTPNDGLGDPLRNAFSKTKDNVTELNLKKVEVQPGFGLTEENFTTLEKSKLSGIAADAEKNVQANWNQADDTQDDFIIGKPENILQSIDSTSFIGAGQTYTISTGGIAFKAWINDGVQHLEKAGFESWLNTFIQIGNDVTFKKTIPTGARIIIDHYL